VAQISKALHTNTTLKFLRLVGNRINDVGAQAPSKTKTHHVTSSWESVVATDAARSLLAFGCLVGALLALAPLEHRDSTEDQRWGGGRRTSPQSTVEPQSRRSGTLVKRPYFCFSSSHELLQARRQCFAVGREDHGGRQQVAPPRPARVTALRWRAAARGDAR
jgi:hypothetical protein